MYKNIDKWSTDKLWKKRDEIIEKIQYLNYKDAFASQGGRVPGTDGKLKKLYEKIDPINELLYIRENIDRRFHPL